MTPLRNIGSPPTTSWKLNAQVTVYSSAMRIGKFPALIFAGCLLSACNSIYLHSNADQKALDMAFSGTQAVKKTELDAIAKHKTNLKNLIDQQRTAVVREQIALRDEWLTNGIDAKAWQDDIEQASKTQFKYLIDKEGMVTALSNTEKPVNLYNFISQARRHQSQMNATGRQLAKAVSNFKGKGGVLKSPCGQNGEAPTAETNEANATEFETLKRLCAQFKGQSEKAIGNYAPMVKQPSLVRCLSGDLPICESETGVVYDAFASLLRTDELLKINKQLSAAIQQQLSALETGYRCAIEIKDPPEAERATQAAKSRIQQFVDNLPDTAAKLQQALEKPPAKKSIPNANCPGGASEETEFVDLLLKTGNEPKAFASLLQTLETLGVASRASVAAAVSAGKANYEVERLTALANAVAEQKNPALDQAKNAAAKAGIDTHALSGALDAGGELLSLIGDDAEQTPDPKVVLIDLAMARYRQSLAGIETQRLKQARELLQVRTDALLNQLSGLDKALAIAKHDHREEAIVALAQSWNSGAIPAAAAGVELRGQQFMNAADLDEAAVTARYGTLEPLLAELQAYGAGGFTAEDIARFLSAAALVGVAVGAN